MSVFDITPGTSIGTLYVVAPSTVLLDYHKVWQVRCTRCQTQSLLSPKAIDAGYDVCASDKKRPRRRDY